MPSLLVRNADWIATLDDAGTIVSNASIHAVDGVVRAILPAGSPAPAADRTIDARGRIVLPGLVNTHHHFFQTLTRNLAPAQQSGLFDWLRFHYPIWGRLTPDAVRTSAKVAIAELLLSGCTTAADHPYLWTGGARLDDEIEAAREMGIRFHAARGSMSLGASRGGLPPDVLVEDEEAILTDCRRVIETYHDLRPYAMIRIALAPCSPFSVSLDLMRESARLARASGVHCHTHMAETLDELDYCLALFGRRPVALAEDLGWVGADVWHAHMVHPDPAEIARLGATRTGIAHCPTSNMRLGSGIAPISEMAAAGARVGLGVDGSASNDSSHMLAEARQAMLLQRVARGAAALTAGEALRLATRGGAAVLGRDDIGHLAAGMAADFIGFRLDTLGLAGGAVHDPVAALVFCAPPTVDFSVVGGEIRVVDGNLVGVDLPLLVERHNALALRLVRSERG